MAEEMCNWFVLKIAIYFIYKCRGRCFDDYSVVFLSGMYRTEE